MKTCWTFTLMLLSLLTFSQELSLNIKGLRSKEGSIQLTVYQNQATFHKEEPFRVYTFGKQDLRDSCLMLTINDLETGTWGIALIDDENGNGRLDFQFFMPSEGFSFSNMPFREKRKPDFSSFSFYLDEDGTEIIFEVYYFSGKEKMKHRNKD